MTDDQMPETLDKEAFRRVWGRVMPQDRADCPFTIDPPGPGPGRPSGPMPTPPSFLGPPPRPMPVPPRPTREDASDLKGLLDKMSREVQIARALTRRWSGDRLLRELARTGEDQLGRLSAAFRVLTGKRYTPPRRSLPPLPRTLSQALLRRRQSLEEIALALLRATEMASPWLKDLYRQLARENQNLVERIDHRLKPGKN